MFRLIAKRNDRVAVTRVAPPTSIFRGRPPLPERAHRVRGGESRGRRSRRWFIVERIRAALNPLPTVQDGPQG